LGCKYPGVCGKAQVDDQAVGFSNDRVSLAVDALDRVCVVYIHKPTVDFQNQIAARVLQFDGANFTYLTHSFFPFVNYDADGTATPSGDGITGAGPSVAMTTREICIAAKMTITAPIIRLVAATLRTETTVLYRHQPSGAGRRAAADRDCDQGWQQSQRLVERRGRPVHGPNEIDGGLWHVAKRHGGECAAAGKYSCGRRSSLHPPRAITKSGGTRQGRVPLSPSRADLMAQPEDNRVAPSGWQPGFCSGLGVWAWWTVDYPARPRIEFFPSLAWIEILRADLINRIPALSFRTID